jgi:ketosteroid isomerase-like protein
MMPANKTEIVRELFTTYFSNDREAVEAAFTDDFHFTGPYEYDDEIDKATYFECCWLRTMLRIAGRTMRPRCGHLSRRPPEFIIGPRLARTRWAGSPG